MSHSYIDIDIIIDPHNNLTRNPYKDTHRSLRHTTSHGQFINGHINRYTSTLLLYKRVEFISGSLNWLYVSLRNLWCNAWIMHIDYSVGGEIN